MRALWTSHWPSLNLSVLFWEMGRTIVTIVVVMLDSIHFIGLLRGQNELIHQSVCPQAVPRAESAPTSALLSLLWLPLYPFSRGGTSDPTPPWAWGHLGQLGLLGRAICPAGPTSLPLMHPHLLRLHPHRGISHVGFLCLECFSLLTRFQPKCPPPPPCPRPLCPSHLLYFPKHQFPIVTGPVLVF